MAPRRQYRYQGVISGVVFGTLLLASGLAGWDLTYSRGWFQGTRWVDGPVWWQVVAGTALLTAGWWRARQVRRG